MPKRKNYSSTVSVRLSDDLAAQAQEKAQQQKRPLADVLRELLRSWVSKPAK